MKKMWVAMLVLVLAVAFTGCSTTGTSSPGQAVQDWVCNPPADVVQVANLAAGAAATLGYPGVMATIALIQKGACVTVTQINQFIDFLTSQKLAGAKGLPTPPLPSPAPLQVWLAQHQAGK